MFTGIVQARGRVAAAERNAFGVRLVIDTQGWMPGNTTLKHGDSICVSGVCLTLVTQDARGLHFDVIGETLAKTTLGDLAPGSSVNIEPSLTPTSQLGGHFLQGHVDGVGTITKVARSAEEVRITVEPPKELVDYIVPKGSIAIDGVSMTIAAVKDGQFELALIPTTLQLTTLGLAKEGDRANLEADILAKTIVHYLRLRGT
jgi:riboflavin synthase